MRAVQQQSRALPLERDEVPAHFQELTLRFIRSKLEIEIERDGTNAPAPEFGLDLHRPPVARIHAQVTAQTQFQIRFVAGVVIRGLPVRFLARHHSDRTVPALRTHELGLGNVREGERAQRHMFFQRFVHRAKESFVGHEPGGELAHIQHRAEHRVACLEVLGLTPNVRGRLFDAFAKPIAFVLQQIDEHRAVAQRFVVRNRPADAGAQCHQVDGFEEVIERPGPHRSDDRLRRAIAGENDRHGLRRGFAEVGDEIDAASVGEAEVNERARVQRLGQFLAGVVAGPRADTLVPQQLELLNERVPELEGVFHQEDLVLLPAPRLGGLLAVGNHDFPLPHSPNPRHPGFSFLILRFLINSGKQIFVRFECFVTRYMVHQKSSKRVNEDWNVGSSGGYCS